MVVLLVRCRCGRRYRVPSADCRVPTRLRRLLRSVAIFGAALNVLQIGIRGAMLVDVPFVDLLGASTWKESFRARLGLGLLVALAGMLVCAMGLAVKGGARRVFGVVAVLLVLASFPLSGHAATASTRWLTLPALFIHAAVAVFWLGSLWPLWMQLRSDGRCTRGSTLLERGCVRRIAVGRHGSAIGVRADPAAHRAVRDSIRSSCVGEGAALCLLVLPCRLEDLRRLAPALIARTPNAANRLRRIIGVEALIGGIVLVVTAVLTLTPPSVGGPGSAGNEGGRLQHHNLQTGGIRGHGRGVARSRRP